MYLAILLTCLSYLVGQLATGTHARIAVLFTFAICFGLCSISAGGGFKRPAGFLNAILIGKFLLLGVAIKIALGEPSDKTLRAPVQTAVVMAVGFLGVLLATLLQRQLPARRSGLIPTIGDARIYLGLTLVFLVIGYGGYFISLASNFGTDEIQTGGILGIARSFSHFSSFAVVPALYFAWASQSSRFMTHPLALGVLGVEVLIGLVTTSKEGAMEPPVFYLLASACRYGPRDKRIWGLACCGLLYYSMIVYPYAQYVRHSGGREGNLMQRVTAMKDAMVLTITDPEFRESIGGKLNATEASYFESEKLHPFSRLAMVGEADRLIDGTGRSFTGWETITWSLKLLVPSFVMPDKPIFGPGNCFAHIAGDLGPADDTTQVAYGLMAGLYNAQSYPGVFVGCLVLFTVFYYSFRVWFGDPKWSASPFGTSLWFLILITTFQHSLAEEGIPGILGGLIMPIQLFVLYTMAKLIGTFLPERRPETSNYPSPLGRRDTGLAPLPSRNGANL